MTQMIEFLANHGTALVFTALGFALLWKIAGKWTRKGGYMDQQNDMTLQVKAASIENNRIHAEANARHSAAAERLAAIQEQSNEQLRAINEEVVANRLHHHDPNSPFSAITIHRCLMHATNLLEQYATDNEIETWGEHIKAIRDELIRVETIQDAS